MQTVQTISGEEQLLETAEQEYRAAEAAYDAAKKSVLDYRRLNPRPDAINT